MADFATLMEIVAFTALVVAPTVLLTRRLAGSEGPRLPDILGAPLDQPWPRGVQEEEPLPWQLDRLPVRQAVAAPRSDDCHPVGLAYPGAVRPNGIG